MINIEVWYIYHHKTDTGAINSCRPVSNESRKSITDIPCVHKYYLNHVTKPVSGFAMRGHVHNPVIFDIDTHFLSVDPIIIC